MIKLFESFKEIEDICRKYYIENYTINSDGSISTDDGVYFDQMKLLSIPLKFRVTSDFGCSDNRLSSLEGCPREVNGFFDCSNNQLTSLEGAPERVSDIFDCSSNKLTSLEGAPQEVDTFDCNSNRLTSLKGAPRRISGSFNCYYNKIWSFEGAPDYVGDGFHCDRAPIYQIWELFEDYSKVELFNYYDIIRSFKGKPAIVLDRLNDFLEEIGKPTVEGVKGYITI